MIITEWNKLLINIKYTNYCQIINFYRGGKTCLHHAVYNGHFEMCEYLMQLGCVINASDKKDRRALHFAAYKGHNEIVNALIEKGADVDVKVLISYKTFGRTLLIVFYMYPVNILYISMLRIEIYILHYMQQPLLVI